MSFMKRAVINVVTDKALHSVVLSGEQQCACQLLQCSCVLCATSCDHKYTKTKTVLECWIQFLFILGKLSPMSTQTCGICVVSL